MISRRRGQKLTGRFCATADDERNLAGELRDFEELAVFEGGLVGDDAGDGHVERLIDIDEGGAVLENGGDEFVGEVAV